MLLDNSPDSGCAGGAADNYIRFGMRIGAVLLPFLMGGLNDHMPGDYTQSIINSEPAAWQPFKYAIATAVFADSAGQSALKQQ